MNSLKMMLSCFAVAALLETPALAKRITTIRNVPLCSPPTMECLRKEAGSDPIPIRASEGKSCATFRMPTLRRTSGRLIRWATAAVLRPRAAPMLERGRPIA
jgi:hypothetical protein